LSLIHITNLTIGYENRILTENLSFDVNAGDFISIIGENGAGKSTFVKTLLGLYSPRKGKITFGDGLKKKQVGYLPQQTVVQRDFPATVWEIVLSGCQGQKGLRPFYNSDEKSLAQFNMKRMNITEFAKRSYRNLSGGQQQRVLLARALCASDRLLILDEPVSGLDPKASEDMYNTIRSLNKEGVTIIMISHDISAALKYATHILHMRKNAMFLPVEEYLQSEIGRLYTESV